MSQFCEKGQNVNLRITTPSGSSSTSFATAIDAELNTSDSNGNVCWRFQQLINGEVNLEYFGCGKTASFQPSGGQISGYDVPAFNLYIDGTLQESVTYTYGVGVDVDNRVWSTTLTVVQSLVRSVSGSIGDCGCLASNQCKLTVTDVNSGNLLVKTIYPYACNLITLDGACNGCLPGQIQCTCDNYPGYCCVDCAPIEAKIETMTQQVKRLIPNVG